MLVRFFALVFVAFLLLQGSFAFAQSEPQALRDQVLALSAKKFSKNHAIEANDLLPIVEENGDAILLFELLDWLTDYYTNIGDYEQATLLSRKAATAARRSADPLLIANSEMNIGNIYFRTGDLEQSTRTFQPLRDAYLALGDSLAAGKIEASIALNYMAAKKSNAALKKLLSARDIFLKYGTPTDLLALDQNIGTIYALMDMPESSLPYNKQCLATILEQKDTFEFAPAYGNLAYTYQLLDKFDLALTYYDSSLYYSRLQEQDAVTSVTLDDMAKGYLSIGDYKNALRLFREHQAVKESVLNENTLNRIAELKVAYEAEQQQLALEASEQKILLLEGEAQIRQQRLILIIIGLFFSLVVGLLIFRQWRRDMRYRETKEKLIAAELANERLTSSLLSTRLENKQGDLTDFALDIERKNKFSRELTDRLGALRKVIPVKLRSQVDDLVRYAQGHEQLNEQLEVVQDNIDQVNHEFYQKLKEAFPNLTSSDRELAGLLRLNMTNKEVATNRGISTASAKMARYRLRKKLNLVPSDDINAFLRDL